MQVNNFLQRNMTNLYIGRQAIFDQDLNVKGYELLFRSGETNQAQFSDGNHATSVVIANAFLEMGLHKLVGDKQAFINLTREFILGDYPLPFSSQQLVLEVLEDIQVDDELREALLELKAQGYQLALDDVTNPESVALILDLATIIKVDLMATDRQALPAQMQKYQGSGRLLLAEKVETQQEFEWCKSLGFDLYQGYFFAKPAIIKEKKLPGSKLVILRLIADLQKSDVEFRKLEAIVSQDVSLSYKLLRLMNSAYFGTRSKIESVRQALTLLGLKQIQAWLSLLLLSESENKPPVLLKTAMIRGKMAEFLCQNETQLRPESGFTVGLFSVLEALMDMTLVDILKEVPFSEDIHEALLTYQGPLGEVLKAVLHYERGEFVALKSSEFSVDALRDAYMGAIIWSEEMGSVLDKDKI